jgi:S1-C subfamily serine protease
MRFTMQMLFILVLIAASSSEASAQASLSGYNYAVVIPPTYGDNNAQDIHGLGQHLADELRKKTDLTILPYGAEYPSGTPYSQVMLVALEHTASNVSLRNQATLHFLTSNTKPIYSISKKATSMGSSFRRDVKNAIEKAVKELNQIRPQFDPTLTIAATADRFEMDPDNFYSYLDDMGVEVQDLEGIWQHDEGSYVVGIIRTPGSRLERYKGFIAEETVAKPEWTVGVVKFELTPTAIGGRYTASFNMADFSPQQMSVTHKTGFISFSFTPQGGTEQTFTYLKMYPGDGLTDPRTTSAKEELPSSVISTGSGFVMAKNRVVTNAHVIAGGNYFEIAFSDSLAFPLRLIEEDEANDVAVLALLPNESGQYPSIEGLEMGETPSARLGEEVFTIGFPLAGILSGEHTATDGSVSALSGLGDDPRFLQVSVPVQPGNSGGPLFDATGRVVGMITSKLSDSFAYQATNQLPQNVNFALKMDYILPLLGESKMNLAESEKNIEASRADLIEHLVEKVGQIIVYK